MNIEDLKSRRLSGVSFIEDYVELIFDESTLRIFTNFELLSEKQKYIYPEPGLRDMLCSLINKEVENLQAIDLKNIIINFNNGATLIIPLGSKLLPESAHFVPNEKGPMEVFL